MQIFITRHGDEKCMERQGVEIYRNNYVNIDGKAADISVSF